jgi:hypothetical protein
MARSFIAFTDRRSAFPAFGGVRRRIGREHSRFHFLFAYFAVLTNTNERRTPTVNAERQR